VAGTGASPMPQPVPFWLIPYQPLPPVYIPSHGPVRGHPMAEPLPVPQVARHTASASAGGRPTNRPGRPSPNVRPVIRPVIRPERRARPTRERERKTTAVPEIVNAIAGATTEGLDLINAIYGAIPPEHRPFTRWNPDSRNPNNQPSMPRRRIRDWVTGEVASVGMPHETELRNGDRGYWTEEYSPTPHEKLKFIWKNMDRVDWGQAVENIARNAVEDRLIGSASRATTSNSRGYYNAANRPVGFFTGPAI